MFEIIRRAMRVAKRITLTLVAAGGMLSAAHAEIKITDVLGRHVTLEKPAQHVMAARYSSTLVVLQEGRRAGCGKPSDVLTEGLIRSVYGVDAEILHTGAGTPVIAPIRATVSEEMVQ